LAPCCTRCAGGPICTPPLIRRPLSDRARRTQPPALPQQPLRDKVGRALRQSPELARYNFPPGRAFGAKPRY
jgi:hypothetical protein